MFRPLTAALILALASAPGAQSRAASPITQDSINRAAAKGPDDKDPSLIAKAEVLLDRGHFSPGEIDGLDGDNFRSAVRAFRKSTGSRSPVSWTSTRGMRSPEKTPRQP